VKKDLHEAMYAESRKACVERIDQLTAEPPGVCWTAG
jgi:hypothetical protein